MGITTKDLARLCGVSLGTIDRALRNRPGIRPETRQMILEKVREYGYKPNIVARNLKTRRTSEVGLVVHDLDNEFFAEFVNAVQEIAWQRDFFLQIAVSRRDEKRERTALEHMAGRNVDGILLFPTSRGDSFDEFLRGLGRPVVTVANRVSPRWPFVGLSDRAIQREATREIIRRGYTRLFFVGPLCVAPGGNLYEIEERYAGLREAVDEQPGVEGRLVGGTDYVEELRGVDFAERRTAIVCGSDIFALEILNDLRSRGIRVPQDVGLMGFDSIDALRYVQPRISTVEYPVRRMSEVAFSLLVDPRDPAAEPPSIELPPRILWGDSL
ncbi:MAG TPA: LacI family DNA-binding transcriptional regulator [Spirochaetia bacterium]|nr:LacI family DNA-binding transcriptional regulator [Spirochaetia bacterium]